MSSPLKLTAPICTTSNLDCQGLHWCELKDAAFDECSTLDERQLSLWGILLEDPDMTDVLLEA